MSKKIVLIVICFLAIISLIFIIEELMAREYNEQIYKEITSPDGAIKIIITHYKQYFPYGVKGNIYLEKGGERILVKEFFVDFIEDIDNRYEGTEIIWSEEEKSFNSGKTKLG